MQNQKVATVGIRGNDATNAAALSMFLPATICGVISARVAAILTPLFFVAIGLPSIVERGEASGVDFDTDVAGAEGYTLEWFRGCSVCWCAVRRRSGTCRSRNRRPVRKARRGSRAAADIGAEP
jgi:hypothetical protein